MACRSLANFLRFCCKVFAVSIIAFDIETGSLPVEKLREILPPFDPSSIGPHPGIFKSESVKLGNLKDASKIADKLAAAKTAHDKAIADYEAKLENGEPAYWQSIIEDAALSAITGCVVAIGYQGKKETLHVAIDGVTEFQLLSQFWKIYQQGRAERRSLVGFNVKAFDVPFIAQRSWMLGVEVPSTITTATGYLDPVFVDLAERWKVGNRGAWGKPGYGTLDTIAKSLGIAGKPDNCKGAEFAAKLYGSPEDRAIALSYLSSDLRMTVEVAARLGVA
jgi:DNA polymerase III epsilon subunit-like protein